MKCPWCDFEGNDWDEVNFHCLKTHPEKSELEDFKEAKVSRIWNTAIELSVASLGTKGGIPKEKVMDTYHYFLRELMKSEGN